MNRRPPRSTFFPYPTLFRSDLGRASRSDDDRVAAARRIRGGRRAAGPLDRDRTRQTPAATQASRPTPRSEEHTSELQSLAYLVCRLLLEKKKKIKLKCDL